MCMLQANTGRLPVLCRTLEWFSVVSFFFIPQKRKKTTSSWKPSRFRKNKNLRFWHCPVLQEFSRRVTCDRFVAWNSSANIIITWNHWFFVGIYYVYEVPSTMESLHSILLRFSTAVLVGVVRVLACRLAGKGCRLIVTLCGLVTLKARMDTL